MIARRAFILGAVTLPANPCTGDEITDGWCWQCLAPCYLDEPCPHCWIELFGDTW